jgi:hypothetical protein
MTFSLKGKAAAAILTRGQGSSEAGRHSARGRLRPRKLAVWMLGEGEGVGDSILVLTEEREMEEGRLVDSGRSRGDDGIEEARE